MKATNFGNEFFSESNNFFCNLMIQINSKYKKLKKYNQVRVEQWVRLTRKQNYQKLMITNLANLEIYMQYYFTIWFLMVN